MEKANPTKKAKAKPIAAKKGSEPTAKRYTKVVIPAYGAAAATEKYVTDESESEYERPAPKAKKAKKAPAASAAKARHGDDDDGDGNEDCGEGRVDESPVLPHGAYRHRTGNPPRDEDEQLDSDDEDDEDDEESEVESEKSQNSNSGSESDQEPTVQNRKVINLCILYVFYMYFICILYVFL